MRGGVDLGHDLDASVPGVLDQVYDLLPAVLLCRRVAARLRELGHTLQLEWEGLVIGDVPVQVVKLAEEHHVDGPADAAHTQEVPGRIDHNPPVLQGRTLPDAHHWLQPAPLLQQVQVHQSVDEPPRGVAGDDCLAVVDVDPERLVLLSPSLPI